MSGPGQEFVELFLQEASEHLQFLREYSGVLLDPYPLPDDIERLHIAAHGLGGTAGTYGYKFFSEVTGKLAHIFQYAMNSTIGPDACSPLVEFIYEAIAVLESDLLMISANGVEAEDDVKAFKQRYPFAFQQPVEEPEDQAVMTRPQPPAERRPIAAPPAEEPEAEAALSSATAMEIPGADAVADGPASELVAAVEEPLQLEPVAVFEATQNELEQAVKHQDDEFDLEAQAAQAFAPSLLDLPADDNVVAGSARVFCSGSGRASAIDHRVAVVAGGEPEPGRHQQAVPGDAHHQGLRCAGRVSPPLDDRSSR